MSRLYGSNALQLAVAVLVSSAALLAFASGESRGAIPRTISFQGVLQDASGTPFGDGSYSVTFRLYDDAAAGSLLWQESQSVTTAGGVFDVALGSVTPLSLVFDAPYWLEMEVAGSGGPLSPRIALTAAPYSLGAASVAAGGAVTRLNGKTDVVSITAGPNIGIGGSASNIEVSVPNMMGMSQGFTAGPVTISGTTMVDVATATLSTPAPGYVLVEASGEAILSSGADPQADLAVQIDETAGGSLSLQHVQVVGFANNAPAGPVSIPWHVRRVYAKANPGTYTFRLEAFDGVSADASTEQIRNATVTALYVPVAYGIVQAP